MWVVKNNASYYKFKKKLASNTHPRKLSFCKIQMCGTKKMMILVKQGRSKNFVKREKNF